MKKFNRVLAMVLALITVLAMLPISAIADTWLDVEAEKEQTGNVTTSDVTVTVDPYALLAYLQDGDWVGLLKGMSATGGLESIMTRDEFFDIVPKDELVKLVQLILEDVDTGVLLDCFDVNELLTCFDREALIDLFLGLDNLQAYVKDYDALMSYVDLNDIEAAVEFIDTKALLNDYSGELIDLALEKLSAEDLFDIIDLSQAVKLEGFDFAAAADQDYFVGTVAKAENLSKYADLEAIKGILATKTYEDLADYIIEANAQAILKDLLKDCEALFYPLENLGKYWVKLEKPTDLASEENVLNIGAVYADIDVLLEDVDLEKILLNGYTVGEKVYAPALNLSTILFGDGASIEPLFDFADLFTVVEEGSKFEGGFKYIDVYGLGKDFGYAKLVKISEVEKQIADGEVLAADVAACITDYSAALSKVGVVDAVNAIGSYETVINSKYVANINGLIATFDLDAIADAIISDRKINEVFYVVDMVYDVGVKNIAKEVEFKKLGKLIYESGVIQTLIGMLDVKEYLVQAFNIFAGVQQNVTEIKLDGVVITEVDDGFVKLVPARVIDALENLVPSLGELANLDDSGKLLDASIAISYYADETGDVINTKVINFNFALTAGTDMIRKAAAKLSVLLSKVGYVDLVGGELVAEVTIPSEFATVLRKALEKLADSSDPKMNAIKDKVLAAYTAQPDDFIAFAQGLTFEEVMAVLDAIDPALFGKVYNKALSSRYAEVLLAYIERVTGYDFSDNLQAQNLVNTIAEIPTFEEFAKKLEEVTEIEFMHLLPDRVNGYLDNTVYDVIEKLAEKFGYEFDMYNLLKQAAASTDPFAYLYTAVINKVENFGGVYAFIQRNAIKVANRLMATDCGQKLADNCLMDFYHGNSTFVFDQDITFDAKVVFEKTLDRVLAYMSNYTPNLASKLDTYIGFLVDILISDSTLVHTGFDVTINVKDIYRVDFVNEYGTPFLTTLLPAGTDLSKMVDNYANVEAFNGWVDVATGEFITVVPNKDVVVKADVQGVGEHTVTILLKDSEGNDLPGSATLAVQDGQKLDTYLTNLNELAAGLCSKLELTDKEAALGYVYTYTWDDSIFVNTVEEDIVVYATVTLNKNTDEAHIQIDGLVDGVDYTVELTDEACTVILEKNWNEYDALSFNFNKEFVATLNRNLVLTAKGEKVQKVVVNALALAQLVAGATGVSTIGFTYDDAVNTYAAESGAESYDISFNYGGGATGKLEFVNGAAVEITLPFAGINTDDAKTFVYADETELKAGEGVTVADGIVTFVAPHFSTFTLVNKYSLTVNEQYKVEGFNGELPIAFGPVATLKKNDLTVELDAYYAQGDVIEGAFEATANVPAGLVYAKTLFNNTEFNGSFTMPAAAVEVTHYATTKTFHVYYYVNGSKVPDLTKDYTVLNKPTAKELTSVAPEGVATEGWYWYDQENVGSKIGNQDINLYWVNDAQTQITVNFYIGEELVTSYTGSIVEWRDGKLANLQAEIDSVKPGYEWTSDYGKLTEYTVSDLVAAGTVNFYGTALDLDYYVSCDSNVTVDVDTKKPVKADDVITITNVTNKAGYNAIVTIVYTDSTGNTKEDVVVDGKFKMPYSNVFVRVTYEEISAEYAEIQFTIPAGSTLNANDITNLKSAPAEIVLVDAERGANGDLVLTYRYKVTENFNKNAFISAVNALIAKAQYATTTYIVDGKKYDSENEALANLPEGATFMGWIEMANNVKVAFLEFEEADSNTTWVIVCIVLVVLLIVAVIVLIYVLHISDRLSTSWITKVCTAIVTGFFAFCTFVANVALKVLKLLGIKKEDIIEELPAEPVEDVPAVLLNSEAVATEEVVEEATEEVVAEEAVEEVIEDAPILEAEELVEEATEETAEEVVGEAVAEEAVEEAVAEEAVVEEAVAEEVVEEAVEETVEETVEEATEEENKAE